MAEQERNIARSPKPAAGKPAGRGCFLAGAMGVATVAVVTAVTLAVVAFIFLPRLMGPGQTGARAGQHPAVGRQLTEFDVQPLTGDSAPHGIGGVRGKVMLINIWGTWCPPCMAELPHIADLEKELRSRSDFLLVAISSGQSLSEDHDALKEETAATLEQRGIDMPTYWDPDGKTRRALQRIGAFQGSFPTTILIDRDGLIHGVWEGFNAAAAPAEMKKMKQQIERLLATPAADGNAKDDKSA
jgi:thiol-disulfide isomerase/thioredoxin